MKNTLLFKSILREADKTRFIKELWGGHNEIKLAYAVASILGFDCDDRETILKIEELLPETCGKLGKWADTKAASKLNIDWQLIQKSSNASIKDEGQLDLAARDEFNRLVAGYVSYYLDGGSLTQKKKTRLSFNDTEKFYILPFENENWTFIVPRTQKACSYFNSAEVGGHPARWCIGASLTAEHYKSHLNAGGIYVLALKKESAPDFLNELDYDGFKSLHKEARKYMIEFSNENFNYLKFDMRAWRPCDNYSDLLNKQKMSILFGLSRKELDEMRSFVSSNINEIITDYKCITIESLENGTAQFNSIDADIVHEDAFSKFQNKQLINEDVKSIFYDDCNINSIDLSSIIENNKQPVKICFRNCVIQSLDMMGRLKGKIDVEDRNKCEFFFKFENCKIGLVKNFYTATSKNFCDIVQFKNCDFNNDDGTMPIEAKLWVKSTYSPYDVAFMYCKFAGKKVKKPTIKESVLFESLILLNEADKTRFIKPLYDEYLFDPKQAFVEIGRNPYTANELFPSLEDLVKFADGDVAAKANINWQKMPKENSDEFLKLLDCYVTWKENGGSRKDKKEKRTSFSEREKYFILPIENKNWLFVAPRNYEAAKYMDSAECGGQPARWCIGYEQDDSYWQKYLGEGDRFVLALKKKTAPDKINENDYDDHGREVAKKYMIQISQEKEFEIQAWRPCDDPYDKIVGDKEISALFGVTRKDLETELGDYTKVVNDFNDWPVSWEEVKAGKWIANDDIEIMEANITEFDYSEICKLYGDSPVTITFKDSSFDDIIIMDDEPGKNKLQIVFKNCGINNAYFHPLEQTTLYPRIVFDYGTIRLASYSDISEAIEGAMSELDDEDFEAGYMYDEYSQMFFNEFYENGTIEINGTNIRDTECP